MNLHQLEADLARAKEKARDLIDATTRACQAHVVKPATATSEAVTGRVMSAEERGAIQTLLDDAKALQGKIDGLQSDAALVRQFESMRGGAPAQATQAGARASRRVQSLGQQFTASQEFQTFLRLGVHRGSGNWSSPAIECFEPMQMQATTLTEDPASGGALVVPDYRPGVIPLTFRRTVVADLIAPGSTTSNLVSFMKEKTFTNAADVVKEGLAKPESALIFEAATAAVKKIAHWIPVTEEMLEDVAQVQSIIDARLRLGIDLKEEDELLNGSGIDPHLLGINNLPGITPPLPIGTDTIADAMLKQMTIIATTVFVVPDAFVMNPSDWLSVQLAKNQQGNYMGAGPYAPPQAPMLWGVSGAVTPAQAQGSALVGAFRSCAQVFRRGGVRIDASNSHVDFFIKNLVAIRGEERLAFAVYREAAFGQVTGNPPVIP